jgi:hypothetical protein
MHTCFAISNAPHGLKSVLSLVCDCCCCCCSALGRATGCYVSLIRLFSAVVVCACVCSGCACGARRHSTQGVNGVHACHMLLLLLLCTLHALLSFAQAVPGRLIAVCVRVFGLCLRCAPSFNAGSERCACVPHAAAAAAVYFARAVITCPVSAWPFQCFGGVGAHA